MTNESHINAPRTQENTTKVKKTVTALCITLCLLSTLSLTGHRLSVKAQAKTWTVDADGSADFTKIQEAVNNASPGDTVSVHAGTYNESVEISKSLSLVGEDRDHTTITGQDSDFVVSIAANNVSIRGFTLNKAFSRPSDSGIPIVSSNNIIDHNRIAGVYQGIILYSFSNNVISDNIIVSSNDTGISLLFSTNNWFIGNTIMNNTEGISLASSRNNWFIGNTIMNNTEGMSLSAYSSFNFFFHNNFCDPIKLESGQVNTWSYYNEGNYWRNYTGRDSNGDGIGNDPYSLDAKNTDGNPLVGVFSSFNVDLTRKTLSVTIISNSTVSDFRFDKELETGNRIIRFDVAGKDGTIGFARIGVPTALMNYSFVLVGEEEAVNVRTLPEISNNTNVYLYLTYSHTNQTIMVISSTTLNLYNELLDAFYRLQMNMNDLDSTYRQLLNNYYALLANYSQLQQSYVELNTSYYDHLSDYRANLDNFKSLIYIFAAATAVFIITTIYLSKRSHTPKVPEDRK